MVRVMQALKLWQGLIIGNRQTKYTKKIFLEQKYILKIFEK